MPFFLPDPRSNHLRSSAGGKDGTSSTCLTCGLKPRWKIRGKKGEKGRGKAATLSQSFELSGSPSFTRRRNEEGGEKSYSNFALLTTFSRTKGKGGMPFPSQLFRDGVPLLPSSTEGEGGIEKYEMGLSIG